MENIKTLELYKKAIAYYSAWYKGALPDQITFDNEGFSFACLDHDNDSYNKLNGVSVEKIMSANIDDVKKEAAEFALKKAEKLNNISAKAERF